ncbi:MAG: histidine kinase, partial [Candidatus Rokuibacteriota bacterium]
MIDFSDCTLEPLQRDGELVLYRGAHARSASDVGPRMLLLAPARDYASPATLARLEHEYSLAAELDPRWAARPVALGRHQGRTVLALEDPGGVPLARLLGKPIDPVAFLQLAISLACAVEGVHAAGLIHKDITPAHVLVDSATGAVWLTGFGIASRLRRQRQSPEPPEIIAGTLAYMAPEQTGRMNRSIDSRSDLYALGVILYELLTGSLPFTAADPMEWVHCHVARRPMPPAERRQGVPGVVSAVVTKLLAKTAEDRYQTAAGLERDLRRCLAQWETERRIDAFPLGAHDTPDRLVMPEKLYGRAREIDTLLAAFDRVVTSGMPELVLVSGSAGIGKSAVVNELHKVLVPPRGLFAAGKFDQYNRDIPYATLAQAFQSLIRHLLGKSEAELDSWRAALREALEPNGRLMVDLVPELTLLIGDQPPVPELAPQNAQRRFQLVFRRFIGVFARPDHPLALFLDDLQWLDAGTLAVLEDLLTQRDVQHVLVIGAFRDNEVDAAHPLRRTLGAIREAGARVREISLVPLARRDVGRLMADALRCAPARVAPLAQLVHDKTAGNPFFAIQFIAALAEEGLLTFDHGQGCWSWDLDRIHAKGYTENVVDLMVGKLSRLPAPTQEGLQHLACLGNSADLTTLALVRGTSEEQVHADLWEAVRLELVERLDGAYRFVHDRVREAAYSLIPESSRADAHLRIGRLLVAQTPPEKREEVIFEIVNQLNRGVALIMSQDERERLAEFNLIAGKRAKASNAYVSALNYLVAGAALLDGSWDRRHDLLFPIEFHRAECELLTGERAAAEQRLTTLASHAADMVELARVACLRMDLYWALAQSASAVAVCLDYLRRLGHECSPRPTEEEVRREYDRICSRVGSRAIEALTELPLMSDPVSLATLDVLTKAIIPAWFTDTNLGSWVLCRAVNLSLERGHSDGSCIAYEHLGMIAGPLFDDYKVGSEFGRLGYELVEKRGLRRFQPRTYMSFGNVILPWTAHVRAGRDLVRRAFDAACRIGDLSCAVGSGQYLITNLLAAGDPLAEVEREAVNALEFATEARFGLTVDNIATQLGLIRTLRGSTAKFGCFDDDRFDEARVEQNLASNPVFKVSEFWYWTRKTQGRFLAGDYRSAVDAASRAHRLVGMSPSFLETAECHFYGALSRAASWDSASASEKQQHLEALTTHHRQLEIWAELCPENFENRAALVGAEIARIEGRALDAMDLYEQAIRSARANGFVHNEALANELAARFYAARGFEKIAQAYVRDARYGYLRWGADGKVRQLDELYPYLRQAEPAADARGTIGAPIEHLELATVLNVSQAVS